MTERLNPGKQNEQFKQNSSVHLKAGAVNGENPFPPINTKKKKREAETVSKMFRGCPVVVETIDLHGKPITIKTGKERTQTKPKQP